MRTSRSIHALLALGLATTAACVGGTPGGDDGTGDDDTLVTDGGRYTVADCGYDIVTVAGAEAPAPGADVLGASPAPYQVHLGFAGDPATSMAIVWRTDADTTATSVRFGEGTALDQTASGVTFRYIAGVGGVGDVVRMHEAHLCGLSPDTAYSYQVGGTGDGGTESWSTTYTFRTAPATTDASAEVRIAFVGDSRGGYDVWADLAREIESRGADLILFSGDAVTVGQVQDEWDTFFTAAEDLLATVPIISAHGNHDLNSVNYYSQFVMPGDESSFSFDYGPAHMVVLNDTPLQASDIEGKIRTFLSQDLAANTGRPWTIVNHHRPIWSSGTRHGSDQTLLQQWGPLIDQYHVDLVVAGHDHIYERTKPMNADQVQATTATGTVYVVSGGAGASLYGTEPDYFTDNAESSHSGIIAQVRAGQLQYEAFRPDGSSVDTMTMTK